MQNYYYSKFISKSVFNKTLKQNIWGQIGDKEVGGVLVETNPGAGEGEADLLQAADVKGFRVFNLDYKVQLYNATACIVFVCKIRSGTGLDYVFQEFFLWSETGLGVRYAQNKNTPRSQVAY